jgi:hypothetical protein
MKLFRAFLNRYSYALMFGLLVGIVTNAVHIQTIKPPFLSYPDLPFSLKKPTAYAGETVVLSVARCSSSDKRETYVLAHSIVNADTGEVDQLPPVTDGVFVDPGCSRENSLANFVPTNKTPATYFFKGVSTVQTFWGKKTVSWNSEKFLVIARPAP